MKVKVDVHQKIPLGYHSGDMIERKDVLGLLPLNNRSNVSKEVWSVIKKYEKAGKVISFKDRSMPREGIGYTIRNYAIPLDKQKLMEEVRTLKEGSAAISFPKKAIDMWSEHILSGSDKSFQEYHGLTDEESNRVFNPKGKVSMEEQLADEKFRLMGGSDKYYKEKDYRHANTIMEERSPRSIIADLSKTSKRVVGIGEFHKWAAHPNRYDLQGVDTKHKLKKSQKRKIKSRSTNQRIVSK